jgi:hypothetical protein
MNRIFGALVVPALIFVALPGPDGFAQSMRADEAADLRIDAAIGADRQQEQVVRQTLTGDVSPVDFLIVTYDVTRSEVTKAEIKAEAVPYFELFASTPNLLSRAVLVNADGTTTTLPALRRETQSRTTIELLTPARFAAESLSGVVFQGFTAGGAVFVPKTMFTPAPGRAPRSVVETNDCGTLSYNQDANWNNVSTTCIEVSSGTLLTNSCRLCYKCFRIGSFDFCEQPTLNCKGCVTAVVGGRG